jgi:hypothetical protein
MPLHDWMSHLKPDRKLSELCLPGSHDAGVYKDKDAGVKPGSSTRCQYSNIWQQALHGSRVFDIRCFLRKTGVFNKTKTPTMGHFFKEGKDGSGGDCGGVTDRLLRDAEERQLQVGLEPRPRADHRELARERPSTEERSASCWKACSRPFSSKARGRSASTDRRASPKPKRARSRTRSMYRSMGKPASAAASPASSCRRMPVKLWARVCRGSRAPCDYVLQGWRPRLGSCLFGLAAFW